MFLIPPWPGGTKVQSVSNHWHKEENLRLPLPESAWAQIKKQQILPKKYYKLGNKAHIIC